MGKQAGWQQIPGMKEKSHKIKGGTVGGGVTGRASTPSPLINSKYTAVFLSGIPTCET